MCGRPQIKKIWKLFSSLEIAFILLAIFHVVEGKFNKYIVIAYKFYAYQNIQHKCPPPRPTLISLIQSDCVSLDYGNLFMLYQEHESSMTWAIAKVTMLLLQKCDNSTVWLIISL